MTSDRIVDLPAGRSTEPSVHHATALADAAYTTIKERIRTCQLAPGQRITEKGLVEDTGYGKTPVREGLGRLVNEQLVDVMPRSGYRVRFNEPYSGRDGLIYSARRHGRAHEIDYVELEINNGLIRAPAGQRRLGRDVAAALSDVS